MRITIGYFPSNINPNSYTSRMLDAFKKAFPQDVPIPVPASKKILSSDFKHIDVFWFNWFENIYSKNIVQFVWELMGKLVLLSAIKIYGRKLVVVFHNKSPHESLFPNFSRWFYKFLLKRADKIAILCEDSREEVKSLLGKRYENRVCKVLHPTYDCEPKSYPKEAIPATLSFFGLIRPYKNVEMIIELAKKYPDINFFIGGKSTSESYAESLKKMAEGCDNITIKFGTLSNDEIEKILNESSALLLPYNINTSLNSGVVMWALSKGVNVIVPKIGTVSELNNKELVYYYEYESDDYHFTALQTAVEKFREDYTENYYEFVRNAQRLNKEISYSNSIEIVINQVRTLINEL